MCITSFLGQILIEHVYCICCEDEIKLVLIVYCQALVLVFGLTPSGDQSNVYIWCYINRANFYRPILHCAHMTPKSYNEPIYQSTHHTLAVIFVTLCPNLHTEHSVHH